MTKHRISLQRAKTHLSPAEAYDSFGFRANVWEELLEAASHSFNFLAAQVTLNARYALVRPSEIF